MRATVKLASVVRWRFYLVLFTLCAFLLALLWHLASLQILPANDRGYEFLQQQGLDRILREEEIPALRGMITDRNGQPLAVSTPVVSLWANPKELLAVQNGWSPLLKALTLSEKQLLEKLERYKNKEFMYLRRHLTPVEAEKILRLEIGGVYGDEEYRRFYPAGEVAAQLIGFTNIDDQGQEGLELAYDQWLRGESGAKQVLKDRKGRIFKDVQLLAEAKKGNDLALSIDLRLQYLAYRELKEAVKAHGAQSGSVVLLDAKTGEVLAMANQPSFNPNDRRGLKVNALRNRAMTDQFEPGSTMKPLTIMAAMESGQISATTTIDTHPGHLRVGSKTLLDPVNYGVMDIAKIVQKSSQVGLTKISLEMSPDEIRDMYFRVGLGQDTGTGFPGESTGLLPNHARWQPIVQANFSFGYGVSLTTLQLAQAYSVIANSGEKRPVSLLRLEKEIAGDKVISPKVARQMVKMLQGVVQPAGTGTRAGIDAYPVAGKTGTIHKVGPNGYADDRYISLFAGFAPANDPAVVAVVVIHEPSRGQYFGGEVAAPVFSNLVERSLRLLQVPPQNIEEKTPEPRLANQSLMEPLT